MHKIMIIFEGAFCSPYFFSHALLGMKTSDFCCLKLGRNAHTVKLSKRERFQYGARQKSAKAFFVIYFESCSTVRPLVRRPDQNLHRLSRAKAMIRVNIS